MSDARLLNILRQAQTEGLLGKGPVLDHVRHARALSAVIPAGARQFVDLGSGGGVPGLVIAWDRPELIGSLVDGSTRRGDFLRRAVDDLGIAARVSVVVERAELVGRSPAHRGKADVVVARSFGPPAVVAECGAPLLEVGGTLIVSDPPAGTDRTDRWPNSGLAAVGLRLLERRQEPVAFTVLEQFELCPERFPRRVGIPAKRPLF